MYSREQVVEALMEFGRKRLVNARDRIKRNVYCLVQGDCQHCAVGNILHLPLEDCSAWYDCLIKHRRGKDPSDEYAFDILSDVCDVDFSWHAVHVVEAWFESLGKESTEPSFGGELYSRIVTRETRMELLNHIDEAIELLESKETVPEEDEQALAEV